MTIPAGYVRLDAMGLMDLLQGEEKNQQQEARKRQIRAQAEAQVCHAMRTTVADMTPAQRELVGALERRMNGSTNAGKGFGFTLDTSDRKC